MLSDHEQRAWDQIESAYRAEADEVARIVQEGETVGVERTSRLEDVPAPLIGGMWAAFLLVLFGAPLAGLAVGAVTGLMLLLWRFMPQQEPAEGAVSLPVPGNVPGPWLADDARGRQRDGSAGLP